MKLEFHLFYSSSVKVSPNVLPLCPMAILNQLFYSLRFSSLVPQRLSSTMLRVVRSLNIAAVPSSRRGTRGGKSAKIAKLDQDSISAASPTPDLLSATNTCSITILLLLV